MGVQTPPGKREVTHKAKPNKKDDMKDPLIQHNAQGALKECITSSSSSSSLSTIPSSDQHIKDNNSKHKSKVISNFGNDSSALSQSSSRSSPSSSSMSSTSISSLQFHIHILYTINICLILLFASAGIACYLQITAVKRDLSHHKTITSQLVVDIDSNANTYPAHHNTKSAVFTPYHKNYFKFQKHWDVGERVENKEQDVVKHGERTRSKRHASSPTGGTPTKRMKESDEVRDMKTAIDAGKDWMWMSSYTRIPRSLEGMRSQEDMMEYLKSYCMEARLYCAAEGKQGLPGSKGEKGDDGRPGFTGSKGDKGDGGAIAQNIANGRAIRGPPGPKGDHGSRGERGMPGERGRIGKDGRRGSPGLDGMDGVQGARGDKGDPGKRGLLGFPGVKGETGLVGPRGPKGERGMRGVEGLAGPKGERGYTGAKGSRGISGIPGVPGLKGISGTPGHRGLKGERGVMGMRGRTGHCEVQCLTSRKPTTAQCSIKMIGKPVYLRESRKAKEGAFMIDSHPVDSSTRGKVWMTSGLTGLKIHEFSSMRSFTKSKSSRILDLHGVPYFGTGHIVYKGCFYYHQANTHLIVRYNISAGGTPTMRDIKDASYSTEHGYLYQSQKSFFHFHADSNGLWVVYVNKNTGKLNVAMLEPKYLDVVKAVEVDIMQGTEGNAFIACGKLYTLNSFNQSRAKFDKEYDIWTGKSKVINLYFGNPYRSNKMLSYDDGRKKLYSWDHNVHLSIPVLLASN